MVVETRSKDGRFIGLHVGDENARRYFPVNRPCIEILLGHLHIECVLPHDFWRGHPEIRDPRLADWLVSICRGCVAGRTPIQLVMLRETGDRYRVLPGPAPTAEPPAKRESRLQRLPS